MTCTCVEIGRGPAARREISLKSSGNLRESLGINALRAALPTRAASIGNAFCTPELFL
jgi:hypothetical protein